MQVASNLVWFTCEQDGIPVCQRLVCLLCSGCLSLWGSRLCRAAPGEWTGEELNRLIWEKLRKHRCHRQRQRQPLFESVQTLHYVTHYSAVKQQCCVQRDFITHGYMWEFLHLISFLAQSPTSALTDGCSSPGPASFQFQTHRFEKEEEAKDKE